MTPTGILVLGAGRSGTSTLTRALLALGVNLGKNLKKPTRKNPRGFFEEVQMLSLSKQVRRTLGLRAEHVRLLQDSDWQSHSSQLSRLRRRMRKAIVEAMGDSLVWGFKYASTGKLLPFWLPLFTDLGVEPAYILAYRNPLSIAASRQQLDKRRGKQEKTDLEWLANVVPYLHLTAGKRLCVVDYDRLIADPYTELKRIALLLELPYNEVAAKRFAEDFVNPALQHNRHTLHDLETDRTLNPLVRTGALLLSELAQTDAIPTGDFWAEWSEFRAAVYAREEQHRQADRVIDKRLRAQLWHMGQPISRFWNELTGN